jgi:hypothetical protein
MISYVLAVIAALAFGVFFARRTKAKWDADQHRRKEVRKVIESVFQDVVDEPLVTAGVESWRGQYDGRRFQVRTIVDTLATRKLPALWLSVTLNEPVQIDATFDMMARPNSATTFSNFELLAHSVKAPQGYPEFVGVRTDRRDAQLPFDVIAAHLDVFNDTRTKELLITPNGVRLVVLAAEADRARYGVFRQADFSDFQLNPLLIKTLAQTCARLRADINKSQEKVAA